MIENRSAISAHELLSGDSLPRSLVCRGLSLNDLARRLHMVLDGKGGEISRFTALSGLNDQTGLAVTYLNSTGFASFLREGDDVAVITRADLRGALRKGNIPLLVEDDPHDCFYTALAFAVENGNYERLEHFISPKARIHPLAAISENVHIDAGASIGAGAVVLPNTYIGEDVVIKPNATIGGDGFENAVIGGRRSIVPHAGGAWLSGGAQVGSSTCIDRGLFGDFSIVGQHTTIDNLVHFAHSARTGKNCSLVACSEISGGVVLGDGVWLGPNVSVNQSLTIGSHCYVGTGAVITRDLPPHSLAYGSPAKVMAQVCVCRKKLQFQDDVATCATCGKHYRLDATGQVQHA